MNILGIFKFFSDIINIGVVELPSVGGIPLFVWVIIGVVILGLGLILILKK